MFPTMLTDYVSLDVSTLYFYSYHFIVDPFIVQQKSQYFGRLIIIIKFISMLFAPCFSLGISFVRERSMGSTLSLRFAEVAVSIETGSQWEGRVQNGGPIAPLVRLCYHYCFMSLE